MLGQHNYQKNLNFLKKLAEDKDWRLDFEIVDKSLGKDNPRFFYFPFFTSSGEELFFKSCLWGRMKLRKRIIKEFKLVKWLGELGGPVKEIKDFGENGEVFWYVSNYLSLEEGIVCREENIDLLKLADIDRLASRLVWLWGIKKETIPLDLKPYIYLPNRERGIFPGAYRRIEKYLKTLKGAFRVPQVDWKPVDEAKTRAFFKNLKNEILSFENGQGLLVHGDLAPNNIFFAPQRVVFFDWESAYWSDNLLLSLGVDLANFYTRCWVRPELGERLIKGVASSLFGKKNCFSKALKIAIVFSVLEKMAPMFKQGFYKKKYDQDHFEWLIKTLRENI